MRLNSNHQHACGKASLDPSRRVLEHNAVARSDSQQVGGPKEDIGERLGPIHLMSVHDCLEPVAQAQTVEHEIDVRGLRVRSNCEWERAPAIQKLGDAGHEMPLQLTLHQLAIEALFRRPVIEDFRDREMAGDELRNDVVIAPAMHPRGDIGIGRRDAQPLEIHAPSFGVQWHGIDNHAVEIEDQSHRHAVHSK